MSNYGNSRCIGVEINMYHPQIDDKQFNGVSNASLKCYSV